MSVAAAPADFQRATQQVARDLVDVGRYLGERGLVPASSGNLSARIDAGAIGITRTSTEKAELTPGDIIVVHLDRPLPPGTSAETALHLQLYRGSPAIGAVLHVHSLASTVLSDLGGERIVFRGYELQKAVHATKTHEADVILPIFRNSQDIARLAETVQAGLASTPRAAGYLLAGHGLYTWGRDVAEARRTLVALEFLLTCELEKRRIGIGAR